MTARRIQLRRTKGWRKPAGAVVVARPRRWANPFEVGVDVINNAEAVGAYRNYLAAHPELVAAARRELAGRDLACWCPLDAPCHADVLLEVANGGAP